MTQRDWGKRSRVIVFTQSTHTLEVMYLKKKTRLGNNKRNQYTRNRIVTIFKVISNN